MMPSYAEEGNALGSRADAEVAALATSVETLTASNTYLSNEAAALKETNTLLQDRLTAARARVIKLRAALQECQGTTPAPLPPTTYGSSTGKHTFAEFTERAGKPLASRRSYESGIPPALKYGDVYDDFVTNNCISINSIAFNPNRIQVLKSALFNYLDSIPAEHDLRFIVSHEPEKPEKKYVPAEYVYQQKLVRAEIIDPINERRLKNGGIPIRFGGNWMAWSARAASGRHMELWYPGPGVWDYLAWDGYSEDPIHGPDAVFRDALTFTKARNERFAIAETGLTVNHAGPRRVEWIDKCQQYAKDNNSEFWQYWDGSFWTAYLTTDAEFKAVVNPPL
jgi:hypothetical protein